MQVASRRGPGDAGSLGDVGQGQARLVRAESLDDRETLFQAGDEFAPTAIMGVWRRSCTLVPS